LSACELYNIVVFMIFFCNLFIVIASRARSIGLSPRLQEFVLLFLIGIYHAFHSITLFTFPTFMLMYKILVCDIVFLNAVVHNKVNFVQFTHDYISCLQYMSYKSAVMH